MSLIFKNRAHAGKELAAKLRPYRKLSDTIVIALARGGVPVGFEVAQALGLPLDVTCPRKIGAPYNPEYAIGAITERGEGVFNQRLIEQLGISSDYIEKVVKEETENALKRCHLYRKDAPLSEVGDKRVILVDDGLATGSTMKAAIQSIRSCNPREILVAVPVSPPETVERIEALADKVVVLSTPPYFQAVGQFYEDFSQTSDEEVIRLLERFRLSTSG